jgi:transposase InsO family protein
VTPEQKKRLGWIQLYQQMGNAGVVCRRCGISRPTLRKWLRRYESGGIEALYDQSRRPQHSPSKKVSATHEELILYLRRERKLGARRIQSELQRLHGISFSLAMIHKVLARNNEAYLKPKRHYRKQVHRYSCQLPGERVQMDVCKIGNNLYQYTAIDDCTRYKVIALYGWRSAESTLDFLDQVMDRMPFSIQRIQTDRGQEFFAYQVQERLMEWGIKFRPIRPGAPHLNGKVERSQRTDLDEFYSTVDLKDPELELRLAEWEFYYNWYRPHSSLSGKAPNDRHLELIHQTPLWADVGKMYDRSKERIIGQNYILDFAVKVLKPSL